jgi:hypothetical protein
MPGLSNTLWAFLLFSSAATHAQTNIPPGPVFGTWTESGSPYLIQGEITIPADSTLTIQPGVDVVFQGHYKFIVHGYLRALGTETDSILFTAADTTIGWHGIRFTDSLDSSHLSYCNIQYGSAVGSGEDNNGGGLYVFNSNPVIQHCTLSHNFAYGAGGGVYIYSSNPIIADCLFNRDISNQPGGGILCYQSNAEITNSTFVGNGGIYYGGIYCGGGSNPSITNCSFIEPVFGATISCVENSNPLIYRCLFSNLGDVAISCNNSNPSISDCDFNDGWWLGTAIYCAGTSAPAISYCDMRNNSNPYESIIMCSGTSAPQISNCIFSNNEGLFSGAIACLENSHPIIDYCLMTGNYGIFAGAVYCSTSAITTINNCTIAGNTGEIAIGGTGGIRLCNAGNSAITNTLIEGNNGNGGIKIWNPNSISVTYCDLSGNANGNIVGDLPPGLGEITATNLNGDSCDIFFNLFLDPLFIYPFDYHLQSGSPCIDAGDPSSPLDPDSTIADIGTFYFHQTGIPDDRPDRPIPMEFNLYQNYPNPFNETTIIPYCLPQSGQVILSVYNILGQRVATLYNGFQQAGHHESIWQAQDLASGFYIAQLQSRGYIKNIKMLVLK